MRRSHFLFFAVLTAVLAVVSGCKSDYSEEAAETASKYALENLKGLTEAQRHFIQFTPPTLYSNLIIQRNIVVPYNYGHVKVSAPQLYPIAPDKDLMHHCFVWDPPGLGNYVVVVGDGERSLRFWKPFRVILKTFDPADVEYLNAANAAAGYAANNMTFLTQNETNRIRFSEPEVFYTRFPLVINTKRDSDKKTQLEEYLEELEEQDKDKQYTLTQITLVWKADDPDQLIAFSGFSRKGCLNEWALHQATYVTQAELKSHTLTQKEIDGIKKEHLPIETIFPVEPEPFRGHSRKPETGSIFGGDLKF